MLTTHRPFTLQPSATSTAHPIPVPASQPIAADRAGSPVSPSHAPSEPSLGGEAVMERASRLADRPLRRPSAARRILRLAVASAAWAVIWVADTLGSRFTRTSARSGRRFANRLGTRFVEDEEGTASAEYAVVCLAAVAFGGVLYTVITGGSVVAAVTAIIQRALSVDF